MAETKHRQNSFRIIKLKSGSNSIKEILLDTEFYYLKDFLGLDLYFFFLASKKNKKIGNVDGFIALSRFGQMHCIKTTRTSQNDISKNIRETRNQILKTKHKKKSQILFKDSRIYYYYYLSFFFFCFVCVSVTSRDNDRKTPLPPTGVSFVSQSKNSRREIQKYFHVEN
jgi:hypothetical protein